MSKFVRVTKPEQIPVGEVLEKSDLVIVDGNPKRIALTFSSGRVLEVGMESYSFAASITAPPVLETRYRVSGELLGNPISTVYESEHDAKSAVRKLDVAGAEKLRIEKVLVDEDTGVLDKVLDEEVPF